MVTGLDGLPVALDEVGRNLPVRSCGVRLVGTRQVGHGQNLVGSGEPGDDVRAGVRR